MAFKGWSKIDIKDDNGKPQIAISPVIISASRATDIPAFHCEWFLNRLRSGYVVWKNPFNQTKQYVSFEKTRVFVFWTKDPKDFLPVLDKIEKKNKNFYFQYTLNDYENEGLEPHVPPLSKRFEIFKRLSDRIGKEKVIWRFDPLILTDTLSKERLIEKVFRVGRELGDFTEKLVISFADIECYKKVQNNLRRSGINYRNFLPEEIKFIASELQKISTALGLRVATCAEHFDLSDFGIEHNKCVDDELMIKLFPNDKDLLNFFGVNGLFKEFDKKFSKKGFKDKGQRKTCGCIVSKDIGSYNTCKHMCLYCYANYSESAVNRNFEIKVSNLGESIIS